MDSNQDIRTVAIVGGTGALGTGLARRWARAGYGIVIGSRTPPKAEAAATELLAAVPDASALGLSNADAAAAAELVVLTVPFAHQRSTLDAIRSQCRGKIVVDTTVPLVPPKVARVQLPDAGCAAVVAQEVLGDEADVVSAFHNVAADLMASDAELDCDVLVAGDKQAARETVIRLAEQAGFRAWHAGPLVNSAAMEALTSVLIFINKRYPGSHAGIRMTGVSKDPA